MMGVMQRGCESRKQMVLLLLISFLWNALLLLNFSESVNLMDISPFLGIRHDERNECNAPPLAVAINASHVDTKIDVLQQPAAINTKCSKLRREWENVSLTSSLARRIESHQTNCSLPTMTFHVDNNYGLGSHLYLWSQALCNAWDKGFRIQTVNPEWLWLDRGYCDSEVAVLSPFLCYFPQMEHRCPTQSSSFTINVTDPRQKSLRCSQMMQPGYLQLFRAASMEYIFQAVSPVVIAEARRQISILFGANGVPNNLITVHVRWGDKFWEMDLAPISEYITAVHELIGQQRIGDNVTESHIYLSTEDPKAAREFQEAAPSNWNVYTDRTVSELNAYRPAKGNRASWTTRNTKGRAGLVALGSLLVALEADFYVLTTKSNWSRLMNELRKNVLDPRCNNCTMAIDLRPGEW